jgi:hypothetical protein
VARSARKHAETRTRSEVVIAVPSSLTLEGIAYHFEEFIKHLVVMSPLFDWPLDAARAGARLLDCPAAGDWRPNEADYVLLCAAVAEHHWPLPEFRRYSEDGELIERFQVARVEYLPFVDAVLGARGRKA